MTVLAKAGTVLIELPLLYSIQEPKIWNVNSLACFGG
jgi:hypothetical protein